MTNITIASNETSTTPVLLDELGDSLTVFGQLETEDTPSVITQDNLNRIFIDTNGIISSVDTDGNLNGSDTGIQVEGTNTIVDNQGSINGDFNGINVANGGEASAVIFNRGIITSDSRPINLGGDEGTVINSGQILSTADPRNGTVYSDVTANTFFIDNLSEGIIDVGEGNNGDAISLELGAEVDGAVINQGLVQGRGLPDGAPDNQTNQAAAVRLYWVSASGADTSVFHGNIENSGTLTAENGATVLIENRTQLNGSIINSGTIEGGTVENGQLAIDASKAEGNVSIVNSGTIDGDVVLSAGNDLYDGSQGTVSGTVLGNAGNDLLAGGESEDRLQGGSGNDFLADGNGDDIVQGGRGNDFFSNLDGGDDTLAGGSGNDFVRSGSGNKTIQSGSGNDLNLGGDGADLIDGGSGLNLAFGGGGSDRFVLSSGGLQAIADFTDGEDFFVLEEGLTLDQINILPTLIGTSIQVADTGEQIATLVSVAPDLISAEDFQAGAQTATDTATAASTTPVDNVRQGTAVVDVIQGTAGKDFLNGNDGDDSIMDPAGQDFINGDNGNDVINGGSDEDVINGGAGNDVLLGNDFLNGDGGSDVIRAGDGNDFLNGGGGSDRLFGNGGQDFINGDGGSDHLFGGEGADLISGGQGRDRLFGNGGTDALNGGRGDDLLFGGAGFDDLNGGQGDDTLVGTNLSATDIDALTGGEGQDTFILGNEQGNFYSNAGAQDFALIVDFNPEDLLVLNGSAADFSLDNVAQNGFSGVGIFDSEQDLIAIAQGFELDLTAGYVDYV
ncbi:MAG: calcium-binding protein [Cyanophyceae cyanobacterium]